MTLSPTLAATPWPTRQEPMTPAIRTFIQAKANSWGLKCTGGYALAVMSVPNEVEASRVIPELMTGDGVTVLRKTIHARPYEARYDLISTDLDRNRTENGFIYARYVEQGRTSILKVYTCTTV